MGNLLRQFGYNTQALSFYESSLEKYKSLKGEESLEVGKVLLNIGGLFVQQAKYPQAYDSLNNCKDIKLRYFHENHIEMVGVYQELGNCLKMMGKKHFGGSLIEKAKKIYKNSQLS